MVMNPNLGVEDFAARMLARLVDERIETSRARPPASNVMSEQH